MHCRLAAAGLALVAIAPWPVHAQPSSPPTITPRAAGASPSSPAASDIEVLRRDVQALRDAYEQRLRELEARLLATERRTTPATDAAARVSTPGDAAPSPAAARTAPLAVAPSGASAHASPAVAMAPPAPAGTARAGSSFNPAISLVLSGQYARSSRDPEGYRIRGIASPPDAEFGMGDRGFSLNETELSLSAAIDPWWAGRVTIALDPGNAVSVEEALVSTTALGHGLTLEAGRFLSKVGYLNPQHPHAWAFVDAPLAYQAFLGTQHGDDGLRMTWLAPTDRYLELGAEIGRGGSNGNGIGMASLTAHTGGDLGTSHSWRAGVSILQTRSHGQGLLLDSTASPSPIAADFTGNTRVWILDGVWKWAPEGNATRQSFELQGEYLHARHSGALATAASEGDWRSRASGWYLQGIWQFQPGWRAGLRAERLSTGTPRFGDPAPSYATEAQSPQRLAALFEWRPSEFSRLRLQLARDRARWGAGDTQVVLQYQMSLGAHGAHGY